MSDTDDDPLTNLYTNRDDVDRERLYTVLAGLVSIDDEDGSVIYESGYFELAGKPRFVVQLLARETQRLLGEREAAELGGDSRAFAELLDVGHSSVQNYAGELEFVENDDERGGYVIRDHHTGGAIAYLEEVTGTAERSG